MSDPIFPETESFEDDEDEQTRAARLRVGQTVHARWRLDAVLGLGGMAAVYAATHRNGNRVAVKMLHAEFSTNEQVRHRFLDEGYAANLVGHPAAVSVLDDGVSEDGSAFLVMDLLEGETFESRLRRHGRLSPQEVLEVADVLLDVLAAAHDKGIVHRDVKPDNVFITTDGSVKLLDFGIARLRDSGRTRTTQAGGPVGTPAFMPPEQARGYWEVLDGRSDLWAVGATMFTALTGRQVHEARTTNEELLLAMTQRAPSLGQLMPHLTVEIIEVVDRALTFEQEARWPDARAMQAAVREALLAETDTLTDPETTPPPVPSSSPVTLFTPPPPVSRTFAGALPASIRLGMPLAASALGLAIILSLATGSTARSSGASPMPAESSAARDDDFAFVASTGPAYAELDRVVITTAPTSKNPRAVDGGNARSAITNVPQPSPPPPAIDPLERRK
jgi:serine/threonine-protein kinase